MSWLDIFNHWIDPGSVDQHWSDTWVLRGDHNYVSKDNVAKCCIIGI